MLSIEWDSDEKWMITTSLLWETAGRSSKSCACHTHFSVLSLSFWAGSYICEKKIKTNKTHQRYKELLMAIFFICETSVYAVQCYYSVRKFKSSDSEKEKIRYFDCFKRPLQANVILEKRLMETWVKCTLNSPFMHYSKMLNIFSSIFKYVYKYSSKSLTATLRVIWKLETILVLKEKMPD